MLLSCLQFFSNSFLKWTKKLSFWKLKMQTKVKFTNKQPQSFSEKTKKGPFIATSTKLVYSPTNFNESKFKTASSHLPLLATYYQTQHFIQNSSINPDYYNLPNFSQKHYPQQVFFSTQMNVSQSFFLFYKIFCIK